MENCIDGDFVYQYDFDSRWTKDSIQALRELGQLKYYASFPKPMFQLICTDGTFVKGVQGLNECRVIYSKNVPDEAKRQFEKRLDDTIRSF
jgi:hypothetical protein